MRLDEIKLNVTKYGRNAIAVTLYLAKYAHANNDETRHFFTLFFNVGLSKLQIFLLPLNQSVIKILIHIPLRKVSGTCNCPNPGLLCDSPLVTLPRAPVSEPLSSLTRPISIKIFLYEINIFN